MSAAAKQDDLQDFGNQILAIKYKKVGFQNEIEAKD